jgi:hypothetical protein
MTSRDFAAFSSISMPENRGVISSGLGFAASLDTQGKLFSQGDYFVPDPLALASLIPSMLHPLAVADAVRTQPHYGDLLLD